MPLPSLLPEEIPIMPAWYRRRLLADIANRANPPTYEMLEPLEIHRGREVRFIRRIANEYDEFLTMAIQVGSKDGRWLMKHAMGVPVALDQNPLDTKTAIGLSSSVIDALWEWYWLSDFAQMGDAEIRERNALVLEPRVLSENMPGLCRRKDSDG